MVSFSPISLKMSYEMQIGRTSSQLYQNVLNICCDENWLNFILMDKIC